MVDLADDVRNVLFDAGADAVGFNAPLSSERAEALVGHLGSDCAGPVVVDLGCGQGALSRLAASRLPDATVIGVDLDERSIERARESATPEPFGDRLRFEVADAGRWEPVGRSLDGAICVGASHAFGGPGAMFARLAELVPVGRAVVGDGFWQAAPNDWCVEVFGELPGGIEALGEEARRVGWRVVDLDASSLEEWDGFERGWIGGVRRVDLPEAEAFAQERERQYGNYRGVLGFGWLVLERSEG